MSEFESKRDLSKFVDTHAKAFEELDGEALSYEISLREYGESKESLMKLIEENKKNPSVENEKKMESIKAITHAAKDKAKLKQSELTSSLNSFASARSIASTRALSLLQVYHDKKENDRVYNILKLSQSLDLCFVIDATGSMHMDNVFLALKSNIRKLLAAMQRCNPHLDFQLSLVAYRDPEDTNHLEVLPFTTSRTEFETFTEKIKCTGGGDQCEDVLGALEVAGNLDWKFYNRLLFLCGDAPCHGREYHNDCQDRHPDGLPGQISEKIMHKLVEQKVQMFFWKVNETTNKMIERFNVDASKSPLQFAGDNSHSSFITSSTIDITSAESIISTVSESISRSISGSIARSVSKAGSIKPKSIKNAMKKLDIIKEEDCDVSDIDTRFKKANISPADTLVSKDGLEI